MNTTATTRRSVLRWPAALAVSLTPVRMAQAHSEFGLVKPPQPSPAAWLVRDDAVETHLDDHLQKHVSAVQLVFTKCRATCPMQAALFADVARRLRAADAQLLSLSVDPAVLFDRQARLVLRTPALPSAATVLGNIEAVARNA